MLWGSSTIYNKLHRVCIFLSLSIVLTCERKPEQSVKIGLVPISTADVTEAIAASDYLNTCFNHSENKTNWIPVKSMFRMADPDSVSDPGYWSCFAQRLNLTYLIMIRTAGLSHADSVRIQCSQFDPPRLIYTGTLKTTDMIWLADSLQKQIGIESVPAENMSVLETGALLDNSEYWKGRHYELLDSTRLACSFYKSALKINPEHPFILCRLAEVLIDQGQDEQTAGGMKPVELMEAGTVLHLIPDSPGCPEKDLLLARLFVHQSSWNRAEAVLKALVAQDPHLYQVYLLISRLHPSRYREFGFRNRMQLYRKALELNPACVPAYLAIGQEHDSHLEWEKSEKIYKELLRVQPRSLDGLLALGKLYFRKHQTLKMIQVYERILDMKKSDPDVLYNMGIAYYHEKNNTKAVELFRKASQDSVPDAYFYLGVIYLQEGKIQEAVEMFRQRIKLRQGPDDTFADEAGRQLFKLIRTVPIEDPGK
jgi:hypothetical protein